MAGSSNGARASPYRRSFIAKSGGVHLMFTYADWTLALVSRVEVTGGAAERQLSDAFG